MAQGPDNALPPSPMFVVSPECWQLGLRAGALVLRGLNIQPSSADQRKLVDLAASRIQEEFHSSAEIRALPEIKHIYEVLRNVGVKPRSNPPSTQRLLEFALKRSTLPTINNLVDAYNLVSLRTRCSLGAHDLNRLTPPVQLSLFRGDEQYRPLGGDEDETVVPGEFGYIDGQSRVLCRLDSRQADFSKVTSVTTDALLIVESTTFHTSEQLDQVLAQAVETVLTFCGGTAEVVAS